jgi:hypothetical protein
MELASLRTVRVASADGFDTPKLETASIDTPPRPAASVRSAAPSEERDHLRALSAAAASGGAEPAAPIRIAAARRSDAEPPPGLVAAAGSGLVRSFAREPNDLSTDRFSGPAVAGTLPLTAPSR